MINQEAVAAKVPAYAPIVHEVFDFSGGLNTHAAGFFIDAGSFFALKSNQFIQGTNLIRAKNGLLQTRPGRIKINSTPVTPPAGDAVIRSMYELRRSDGVNRICMNAGNTFYRLNGATWTSVGTFATSNLRRSYCQFKEVLLGVDGTNDMCKYDGTTLSAVAAAPKGLAMAAHRNRVWIVKDKTLWYSASGDETDWTTPNNAGSLPIPVSQGTGGTALIPLWDRLIILCGQQVFQLSGTGPADFAMTPINLAYGNSMSCYGPSAAGNDIYFGDSRGVHGLSTTEAQNLLGDVTYNYVSGIVESKWQAAATGNLANAFTVHDKKNNLVLFIYSTQGTNNTEALVADYYHLDGSTPTWTYYTNMPFACAAEVESLSSTSEVLFGDYNGTVYKQSNVLSTDDGANIEVNYEYVTDLGLPQFSKLLRHVMFFTEASDGLVNVDVSFDFGANITAKSFSATSAIGGVLGSTFTIGTSTLGSSTFKKTRLSVPGHGRLISLRLTFAGSSRFTLGGFLMLGSPRRLITV